MEVSGYLVPGFIDAHVHIIGRALGQPGADEAAVRRYGNGHGLDGIAVKEVQRRLASISAAVSPTTMPM